MIQVWPQFGPAIPLAKDVRSAHITHDACRTSRVKTTFSHLELNDKKRGQVQGELALIHSRSLGDETQNTSALPPVKRAVRVQRRRFETVVMCRRRSRLLGCSRKQTFFVEPYRLPGHLVTCVSARRCDALHMFLVWSSPAWLYVKV